MLPTGLSDSNVTNAIAAAHEICAQPLTETPAKPSLNAPNAIEGYKASKNGNGLRVLEDLPEIIARGAAALTPAEKELLKWVGVFFRRPTPGKFMMRVRMPNGFATSAQFRAIADLSRRLGNNVLDITTRQQIELRGFTLDSVPEIWEKLRGVDLRSLQTGIDNIRNINGCALAGFTPNELFDASHVVQELDRIFVGAEGNPEYINLPAQIQHHRHRLPRQLHAQRVAGSRARSRA